MSSDEPTFNHILIINAGGFGRSIAGMARNSDPAFGKKWDIKGFLDNRVGLDNPSDLPILGDPLSYRVQWGDIFVCALGSAAAKRHYTANLLEQGANFIVLRPGLSCGERTTIGRGGLFEPGVSIGPDCQIGEFVTVLSTSIIGHDARIGSYCHIGSFVFVGGGAQIGDDVTIHTHATILPGVRIGDGATVGAGSVVIRDVKPGTTVIGNPAKPFNFS